MMHVVLLLTQWKWSLDQSSLVKIIKIKNKYIWFRNTVDSLKLVLIVLAIFYLATLEGGI